VPLGGETIGANVENNVVMRPVIDKAAGVTKVFLGEHGLYRPSCEKGGCEAEGPLRVIG